MDFDPKRLDSYVAREAQGVRYDFQGDIVRVFGMRVRSFNSVSQLQEVNPQGHPLEQIYLNRPKSK